MRGKKYPPPGGLEPPTFRLTAERASRLRHGGTLVSQLQNNQMRIPINVSGLPLQKYSSSASIRYGLVVRIPGSHPGGPGSIPGNGNFCQVFQYFTDKVPSPPIIVVNTVKQLIGD